MAKPKLVTFTQKTGNMESHRNPQIQKGGEPNPPPKPLIIDLTAGQHALKKMCVCVCVCCLHSHRI